MASISRKFKAIVRCCCTPCSWIFGNPIINSDEESENEEVLDSDEKTRRKEMQARLMDGAKFLFISSN